MGIFFPDYGMPAGRSGGQKWSFAGVAAGHVAVLGLLAFAVPAERLAELARPMTVRLVELAPETPPIPKPEPPRKQKPLVPVQVPPPVLAVAAPVTQLAQVAFTVTPQPAAPPQLPPIATAIAPPPPLVSARFDADYLQNPAPSYPPISKRLGEEGKVLLRVFVSADGAPEKVELRASSGFNRLDHAAQEAVARWRFVPAKRGEQAVTAWVVVPIVFSLKTES